jgi:hypothetical protein
MTGTLHEDQRTFFTISSSVSLTIRNISRKICIENKDTHFNSNTFFFLNRNVYEIMLKNSVDPVRPQMTWRMSISCYKINPSLSNTYCFPLQQYLHQNAHQWYVTRTLPVLLKFSKL